MTILSSVTTIEYTTNYAMLNWKILPLNGKKPITSHGVKDATTDIEQINKWFKGTDHNIGIACGNGLLVIDIDGEKGVESLNELEKELGSLPETVTQLTGKGRHYFFSVDIEQKFKSAVRIKEGIDIRSDNTYVVAAPSIHPETGKRYEWLQGKSPLETIPAALPPTWVTYLSNNNKKSINNQTARRAVAYMDSMPPAIQGNAGHTTLLNVANALVWGFGLDSQQASDLAWQHYNPRCSPMWEECDRGDFDRKFEQALTHNKNTQPRGYLLQLNFLENCYQDNIDYSDITVNELEEDDSDKDFWNEQNDLQQIPLDLLNVPGLIGDVCQLIEKTERKPQPAFRLAAALSLMSVLTSSKIADKNNTRTAAYYVIVGEPACGKDNCLKVIQKILMSHPEISGFLASGKFESRQALVRSLEAQPQLLSVMDEIGNYLNSSVGSTRKIEEQIGFLNEIFTSQDMPKFKAAAYADKSKNIEIEYPSFSILGATNLSEFLKALTKNEIENGFTSRLKVFYGNPVAKNVDDIDTKNFHVPIPKEIIETCQNWYHFREMGSDPDRGNLERLEAFVVPTESKAISFIQKFRKEIETQEDEYKIYARAELHINQLALLYAASKFGCDPENLVIDSDAMNWAINLTKWISRNYFVSLKQNISETYFEKISLKFENWFREKGNWITGRDATQNSIFSKLKENERIEIINTLLQKERLLLYSKQVSGKIRYFFVKPKYRDKFTQKEPKAIELCRMEKWGK